MADAASNPGAQDRAVRCANAGWHGRARRAFDVGAIRSAPGRRGKARPSTAWVTAVKPRGNAGGDATIAAERAAQRARSGGGRYRGAGHRRPGESTARCARGQPATSTAQRRLETAPKPPPVEAYAGGPVRGRSSAAAAMFRSRSGAWLPIQMSTPAASRRTVQFIGSMQACASRGTRYSARTTSDPCNSPRASPRSS